MQIYNCSQLRLSLVGPQVSLLCHPCEASSCDVATLSKLCAEQSQVYADEHFSRMQASRGQDLLTCCCLLQLLHNIQALASKGDLTFAAVGTRIIVCKRAHRC